MSWRGELALALALAAVLGIAVIAGRRGAVPAPEFEPPSTYKAGPAGARGPYEVLRALGLPAERRRVALFRLNDTTRGAPAVLVEIAPPVPFEAGEVRQLVRFVRAGGTLLVAGYARGLPRCVGWTWVPSTRGLAAESLAVRSDALRLPRAVAYLRPLPLRADSARLTPVSDAGAACRTLAPLVTDTLARTASGRPVMVRLKYAGGGAVVLVADDGWLRNRAWRTSDVPLIVEPAIEPRRPGAIAFDEYHQGFGAGASLAGAVLDWLAGTPPGWALLQLALAALVALAVGAVRFGPPRPVIERRRRSSLEHVDALAAGLEGAGGGDVAVRLLVNGLRRRLSRTGRAAGPPVDRAWIASLGLAAATPAARAAVRRLEALVTHPDGAERARAVANAVEDVWEQLRPRRTRDAS